MFIPNINSYIDPDDSVIFLESISRRQESFAKKTLKLVSALDCPPEACKDQGFLILRVTWVSLWGVCPVHIPSK